MRLVHLEIRNFRGIRTLDWCPSPGMNCLIGPGDSTKTTILDAIELVLNPRTNYLGRDTDFYNLDVTKSAMITLTIIGMPSAFCADNRYGLHLRGWDESAGKVVDEPGNGLIDALSIRVDINATTLEGRWSIYNDRLDRESDPPSLRFNDANELATTRLGPYAERHLGWGRQSILNRIGEGGKMSEQLAAASRAAREAFRGTNKDVFANAIAQAEKLSKLFSVQVRRAFAAELDIHGAAITSGGVALHDGDLPLRTLGTGSSRLIVSALQHHARGSHIALVDEIEHGLEPHRIARLLKYLLAPPADGGGARATPQVFLTTHSEVVIRELQAEHIHTVRCTNGETIIHSVAQAADSLDTAQRHLRMSPSAFLARRALVGEGKTECGLLRGLDQCWAQEEKESFALRGVVAIDGTGASSAVKWAQHLRDLQYDCLTLLDSDKPPPRAPIDKVKEAGGIVLEWPDKCSTEERIFLDVPWDFVRALVRYATEVRSEDSVLAVVNSICRKSSVPELTDLSLPTNLDTKEFRAILGQAAKEKEKEWFKNIERGEKVAALIFPCLGQIAEKPLTQYLERIRAWVDA